MSPDTLGGTIDRTRLRKLLVTAAAGPARQLVLDPGEFATHYNRAPFEFDHRLAESPAWTLDSLMALCRRLPSEQLRYRVGQIPGDADFDSSYRRFIASLTLDDVLNRFEASHAYLCIYNPERDPEYHRVIEQLLAEVAVACQAVGERLTWYSSYVFLSTRHSVTPYHMDREMNLLMQIRGSKLVHLWDPADPRVLPPEEQDRLLAYDGERPRYDPAIEPLSRHIPLQPGRGVHHPFIAPHRVQTGDQLSISLALTFRTDSSDRITSTHQFNQRLRRIGMKPAPIGRWPAIDQTKAGAVIAARSGLRMIRRVASRH